MKEILSLAVLLFASLPLPLFAQEPPAEPDAAPTWTTDLTSKLSATQAGFQNWTEGGVNSLAAAAAVNGKATRSSESWGQEHDVRLAFGIVKQDTLNVRKAEDMIRLNSSFKYKGTGFFATFNPTFASLVRTQFVAGFNFDKDPFEEGNEPPVKVSDFMAPGTFTQSLGLTYDPNEWFVQRLGIGAKETIVAIERLRPLYGVSRDKVARVEAGVESYTQVDKEIFKNVQYTSTLGLFAAFNRPDMPDLLWENVLAMKVNSWLGVDFEFVALFDEDRSKEIQLKEVLALGITIVLI